MVKVKSTIRDLGANPNNSNHSKQSISFAKLFSYADYVDFTLMVFGTVGAVANGLSLPLLSVFFGSVIDAFGNTNTGTVLHKVFKICLQLFYLGIGSGAASGIQMACWMVTGERQAARIRVLYLQHMLRQDIAYFDVEMNTSETVGRMSGDTFLIQDAMGEKVGKFVQLIATFIGGFVVGFLKGWQLTLITLSAIPLLVIAGVILAKVSARMASKGQTACVAAACLVEETIGCIRTVVSYGGEKAVVNKYNAMLDAVYKEMVLEGVSVGIGMGLITAIVFSTYALTAWFGGQLVIHNGYTGGRVITILIAVLTGSMSLGQVSPCVAAFAAGKAAGCKMLQLINRKSEIDVHDTKGRRLDDVRGQIEFKNVSFAYPSRPDEEVLGGLNLAVPSGATAALVGRSGCGKSTVISLIERFYDPVSGEVLIDGVNIKEFQLRWMRDQIGLVSQEPVLFSTSIRENISYGKPGAGVEEIKAAAELANAAAFIDGLPQGYETLVGDHGSQLSGGQKQRVAIARAILKNPKVLLLDEATSALDAESEKIVQIALDRIMVNRTTVLVAHRLTTVRNADMILVIERGKVVEGGTHSELLEDFEGVYSQLVRIQEVKDTEESKISSESFSKLRSSSKGSSCSLIGPLNSPIEVEKLDELSYPIQSPKILLRRRLAHLNKPELPHLILGSLAACLSGAILPLYGVLMAHTIKTFFEDHRHLRRDLKFWSLMFVTFAIVSGALFPLRSYFFSVAGSKLVQRIRSKCFEHVLNMEIGWFDEPHHGSGLISARLSSDAATIRTLVGESLATTVQNFAITVAALVIAFTASWRLAFMTLAVLPLVAINSFVETRSIKGFSADSRKAYLEASQVANDAIGSIRTVASFCGEEQVMQIFKEKCEEPRRAGLRLGLISGLTFGMSSFFLFFFDSITFYAGAKLVQSGHASFTDVFQVFFALMMSTVAMSHMTLLGSDSSKSGSAASSIFAIIDRTSKMNASDESGTTLERVTGDIELHRVSFSYPSRPDVQILKDLSLLIHAGKTVALVGESGCGKSTVISLLQRFYDPDSGCITLDNVDIRTLNLKWWRKQMGLVGQEPVLLNDTVRANIAFGKETEAAEAEIQNAADLANAHSFVSSLQNGYETMVGERGVQLSGGQKQRVAIARAIVKEPKILLLDEATSALDAESERVVQHALERVMRNRTTVVVSHRLSTVVNADVIAVVKNGAVVEKGKHETLMEIPGGVYASLVQIHTAKSV